MIVYSLLLGTFLIACLSLLLFLWGCRHQGGWPACVLGLSLAIFIYLFGTWVFLSVFLKYLFVLIFISVAIVGIRRKNNALKQAQLRVAGVIQLSFAIIFLILDVLYFTGTARPEGTIQLKLPFKHGNYFVFQGGRGLPTNIFHYAGRHTLFAMDIIKLNGAGNRANCIFSDSLADYCTYGDTIFSPCDGVILKTENSNPDNIPPNRKRGPANLNHVLIETDNAYIFLGHLQHNGVFVTEGEHVKTGQPLGLAGNSGNSLEPHLHIQAHAKIAQGVSWYRQPQLEILFEGKRYGLFDVIKAGR